MDSRIITKRKVFGMTAGVVILSAGIAIFRQSGMGTDPGNAMLFRISEIALLPFSTIVLLSNLLYFAVEFFLGRTYIGIGTFVNGIGCGYIVTVCCSLLARVFGTPGTLSAQILWVIAGTLVMSLGVSLYQTAGLGIAPYDSLAILLCRYTKLPYFLCRICVDGLCGVICWRIGGHLGVGTLICLFALGPFISVFDQYVSRPFMRDLSLQKTEDPAEAKV